MSSIEWTDVTWNPSVGCSRVSAGCEHCYAERVAHRAMQPAHEGLTVMGKHGPRWNGTVRFLPERLSQPLRWRKPRRVFVDSMSDLFHEGVTNEQIAAVFGVMAACPTHTFQVLTKRPALAVEWFRWAQEGNELADPFHRGEGDAHAWSTMANAVCSQHVSWPSWVGEEGEGLEHRWRAVNGEWPLPNVWLGVSVEDQPSADKRIPMLLKCPAAVRFVSYEPALGPVDFRMLHHDGITNIDALAGRHGVTLPLGGECDALDWIIIGGESGPGARPFDLAWARSTIAQCRTAGVKCFVKQLGAKPIDLIDERHGRDACPVKHKSVTLRDHKGGDMSEWPADLRVREMPRLVEDRR